MTTCIAAHPNDPPLALDGLRLCRHHHSRLARDLADIITCWSLLSELHEPSRGGTGHHGKRADPPAPVNIDVTDVTDPRTSSVIAAMGWAQIVVEERRLAVAPSDVADAAALLTRHIEWVAAQDWADEACDEIGQAARTLRHITGDMPERPIGTCRAPDIRDPSQDCGGPLRWIDGTLSVVCSRCGDTWHMDSLIHLGRVSPLNLHGTVPHIAELLDVPERTVRHWVATGRVARNSFGLVRHADVWHILVQRNGPQQRQTAEGLSTT